MNKKINIGLFAYNFPHRKTMDIINTLYNERFKICLILAADFIRIESPRSVFKFKNLALNNSAKSLAEKYGIPFYVVEHNSLESISLLKKYDINLGVISGARILEKRILESIKYGVLNLHPGLLPVIRGLDSILWSIKKNHPLGVTAHLINMQIDGGKLVYQKKIQIVSTDSLQSLYEKIYQLQLDLIPISLNLISRNQKFKLLKLGEYNSKMSYEKQLKLSKKINHYIKTHAITKR